MNESFIYGLPVMHIDEGEEIAGAWITPYIPEVGMYKLLAKKKKDGSYEWEHFIQHSNGNRERMMRGAAVNKAELNMLLEATNHNLYRVYGVYLQPADVDGHTLDGRNRPSLLQ